MVEKDTKNLYEQYVAVMQKVADLKYASALLQWDQETYMPPKGAVARGRQIATLSETAHQFFTNPGNDDLMKELLSRSELSDTQRKNVKLSHEDYIKQNKYDSAFVRKMAETVNKSFHSWLEARKANDFRIFAPNLSALIELKKQEAELLGYDQHPYDALLNEHDKGSTVKKVDEIFHSIKGPLKELLDRIQKQEQVDDRFLHRIYPKDKQWAFGMELLKLAGYDFERGRQDISEHPFSISFNANDVRVTTRINEKDLAGMTWSCIHELGHAFYEMGLPDEQYGLPLGEAISYTIHESQSRLWENHVGRSKIFCESWFPLFQSYFPDQMADVTSDSLYKAINKVNPSLIRTEADELTYHFHVMIRYELEKQLLENNLKTADIPGFWKEAYMTYLGVDVTDDKQGCLQDVHWSHGSFGYFPTYSLGSFYASQFYTTATTQIPLLEEHLRARDTKPLLQWLGNQIHRYGRMYTSEELCRKISAEGLNVLHFLRYMLDKYTVIYNLG